MKTFAYVDGYNLYNGLMDKDNHIPGDVSDTPLRKYLWLNLHSFIYSYLPKECELEKVYYFTATVRDNPESKKRQEVFWKALRTLPSIDIQLGRHIPYKSRYTEKQSDVKMALQMYCDARDTDVKAMVLVGGDSDQVPTIQRILALNKGIELFVIFPPLRESDDIKALIKNQFKIKRKNLQRHQFPDVIKRNNFPDIVRPKEWT